jgi:hypothetical protein
MKHIIKKKMSIIIMLILLTSLYSGNTSNINRANANLSLNQTKDTRSTNNLNFEQLTIYYKKSGGINGTDLRILYDSNIKELVFVDIVHGIVLKEQPLTQISEYHLIKPIIDNNFFKTKINDKKQCINCLLFTLSVSFNNETNTVYWSNNTKDINNLILISKELEKIANAIYR